MRYEDFENGYKIDEIRVAYFCDMFRRGMVVVAIVARTFPPRSRSIFVPGSNGLVSWRR